MPPKRRIFLDTGVLIAAATGTDEVAQQAFAILNDPDAEFASSVFVRLETIPHAAYNKRPSEVAFYETFFESVAAWVESARELVDSALEYASRHDLGAMDALHVAAALTCQADEIVTTEKPTKPFRRVTTVPVRFISR
ncbi:MAG: PIN domain-containing protein [Chloroflexi bacterium]|nr:PIN domain-containing protein [Chloroflexota bacterium]